MTIINRRLWKQDTSRASMTLLLNPCYVTPPLKLTQIHLDSLRSEVVRLHRSSAHSYRYPYLLVSCCFCQQLNNDDRQLFFNGLYADDTARVRSHFFAELPNFGYSLVHNHLGGCKHISSLKYILYFLGRVLSPHSTCCPAVDLFFCFLESCRRHSRSCACCPN